MSKISKRLTKQNISKKINNILGFSNTYSLILTNDLIDILREMIKAKSLVGVKEKVFDTIDEFSSVECEYLIAYIPDIVWGDTLEILSEKL